jgi:Zn-dependent M28 family amino/carboxypeptidase
MTARAAASAVALALAALAGAAHFAGARASGQVGAPLGVDGQAALRHVERLVAIGPRVAGSPGGEQARAYIVGELRRAGVEALVQPFEADTPHGRLRLANVVVRLPGRRPDVVMLAGHYDTKLFKEFRFVGANDGGSSTALLLELARRLAKAPREYTVWVVWFDGEEARVSWTAQDSLYGSRHMAAELAREGRLPRAMLLVDMIGDRDLNIRRETASTPWLTDILWASAARLGHAKHFLSESQPVEDDHAPFLRAGVPAALLIDFDFPPWHTAADTLDKVSARSLAVVGDVVLDALPSIEHYLTTTPPGKR